MASAPIAFEVFLFDRGRFVGSRVFAGVRQVSVGRGREATMRVEDPLVSGRHAILFVKDGKLFVGDDGSSNGLFVNGKRVQSQEIGPLDEIRIGDSRIKVELIGDDASEAIPSPERTLAGAELPSLATPGPAPLANPEAGALAGADVPPMAFADREVSAAAAAPSHVADAPAQAKAAEALAPEREAHAPAQAKAPEAFASGREAHAPAQAKTSEAFASVREAHAPAQAKASEASAQASQAHAPEKGSKASVPSGQAQPPAQAKAPEAPRDLRASGMSRTPGPSGTPTPGPGSAASMRQAQPAAPIPRQKPAAKAGASEPPRAPAPAAPAPAAGIAAMLQEASEQLIEKAPPARPKKEKAPVAAAKADDSETALPYPPSPPEVDEEAEAERNFVPPFSLLESLVLDSGDAGTGGVPMVEILRYRGDRLIDAARVDVGGTYEITRGEEGTRWRMLQMLRKGSLRLFFLEGDKGNLVVGGQRTTLAHLADEAHLVHKKHRIYAVDLDDGDRAQIWIDGAGYYLRRVRAPRPPPKSFSLAVAAEDRRYAFAGVVGIVAMLGGIWLQAMLSPPELLVMEEEAQFAEISLKDLEMEKPPEPPKPPEPMAEVQAPEPVPEPVQEQPKAPPKQQPRARTASRGPPSAQPAASPPPSAADDALAALAGIVPTGESKLNAAVSNIAAVRAPSGTSSSFAVSGAIGKVPGDEVTLSRGGKAGGGTGRETRAASAVLAGKNVGQVAGGGGTGKVRGVVQRQPARSVGTTGGSLSKEAILKVINQGIARVQSCYERELIANPGLQGKIVFDWVIAPDGSVSSTRVSSSSIASQAVATCIASVIKTWQFPQPSGGSVSVVFPFVFSSQGF